MSSSPAPSSHLSLLSRIIHSHLSLPPTSYTATQLPQAQNNNVFHITLCTPLASQIQPNHLHCAAIPRGTTHLIFRVPKDNVSLQNDIRVRNEVSFLTLAREALAQDAHLIPLMYGWSDGDECWILEEFKNGETIPLDTFKALDRETQLDIMSQIVAVSKSFQTFELPLTARRFGGLTSDDDGVFRNTKCVLPCGGPFESYADFLRGMCIWQLDASENTRLNGWRGYPELRARVERFFEDGLDSALSKVPYVNARLVHADFGLPNMLFDASHRLSAVLNFDFAHVGSPLSEFLFSFYNLGGILLGSAEGGQLRQWMLTGHPDDVPTELQFAPMFNSAVVKSGMPRPATIHNAGLVSDLWWFSQFLCQPHLLGESIEHASAEDLKEMVERDVDNLETCLGVFGF